MDSNIRQYMQDLQSFIRKRDEEIKKKKSVNDLLNNPNAAASSASDASPDTLDQHNPVINIQDLSASVSIIIKKCLKYDEFVNSKSSSDSTINNNNSSSKDVDIDATMISRKLEDFFSKGYIGFNEDVLRSSLKSLLKTLLQTSTKEMNEMVFNDVVINDIFNQANVIAKIRMSPMLYRSSLDILRLFGKSDVFVTLFPDVIKDVSLMLRDIMEAGDLSSIESKQKFSDAIDFLIEILRSDVLKQQNISSSLPSYNMLFSLSVRILSHESLDYDFACDRIAFIIVTLTTKMHGKDQMGQSILKSIGYNRNDKNYSNNDDETNESKFVLDHEVFSKLRPLRKLSYIRAILGGSLAADSFDADSIADIVHSHIICYLSIDDWTLISACAAIQSWARACEKVITNKSKDGKENPYKDWIEKECKDVLSKIVSLLSFGESRKVSAAINEAFESLIHLAFVGCGRKIEECIVAIGQINHLATILSTNESTSKAILLSLKSLGKLLTVPLLFQHCANIFEIVCDISIKNGRNFGLAANLSSFLFNGNPSAKTQMNMHIAKNSILNNYSKQHRELTLKLVLREILGNQPDNIIDFVACVDDVYKITVTESDPTQHSINAASHDSMLLAKMKGLVFSLNHNLNETSRSALPNIVSIHDFEYALKSGYFELQSTAVELSAKLIGHHQIDTKVKEELMQELQKHLPFMIKIDSPQNRKKLSSSIDSVFRYTVAALSHPAATPEIEKTQSKGELFVLDMVQHFFFCLYPGSPHERYSLALEQIYKITELLAQSPNTSGKSIKTWLYQSDQVNTLLQMINSSHHDMRMIAYKTLLLFPDPLPGYETKKTVSGLYRWAFNLSSSPRSNVADSGAILFRLIYMKYIQKSGWLMNSNIFDSSSTIPADWEDLPYLSLDTRNETGNNLIEDLCYLFKSHSDYYYMMSAVAEAEKSIATESAYCVGAVLVDTKTGKIVSKGFSREIPGNTHAEECALIKIALKGTSNENKEDQSKIRNVLLGANLVPLTEGMTMYTTMEPCSKRLSGKLPCVAHLLKTGIKRVIIGVLEPETFVKDCIGMHELLQGGVQTEFILDKYQSLDHACLFPNHHLFPMKKTPRGREPTKPFSFAIMFFLRHLLHTIENRTNNIKPPEEISSSNYKASEKGYGVGLIITLRYCWSDFTNLIIKQRDWESDEINIIHKFCQDVLRVFVDGLYKAVSVVVVDSSVITSKGNGQENNDDKDTEEEDSDGDGNEADDFFEGEAMDTDCRGHLILSTRG